MKKINTGCFCFPEFHKELPGVPERGPHRRALAGQARVPPAADAEALEAGVDGDASPAAGGDPEHATLVAARRDVLDRTFRCNERILVILVQCCVLPKLLKEIFKSETVAPSPLKPLSPAARPFYSTFLNAMSGRQLRVVTCSACG